MANKDKKKILDEIDGDLLSPDETLSEIGKGVLNLIEKNHKTKVEGERKEYDKKLSQIKDDLTASLSEISKSFKAFKQSVEEDTSLEEGFESMEEEVDTLQEEIEELRESIETAFTDSGKRQDEYGVSLMSLSDKLNAVSKTIEEDFTSRFTEIKKAHAIYDESVKSLHKGHGVHLERFDIVDKHFLQLEKDLKKYASQIYEYGSSFSILNNGTLIGTSNALNFKAGSNITITITADTKGAITAQFDATGGGGLSELAATGSVNGANQTFTFLSVPTYLVIDGVWYKKKDSNNVVQWSNSGLTITTNITPVNSIFGF